MSFDITDYLEIQRLMHQFNLRFDDGDADGFADLFAPDGVLESASAGASATPEARRAKVADASARRPAYRHFTTNVVIEPDGDERARATSCWLYMELHDGTIVTRGIGTYTDEIVKSDGRWLFFRRTATATASAA